MSTASIRKEGFLSNRGILGDGVAVTRCFIHIFSVALCSLRFANAAREICEGETGQLSAKSVRKEGFPLNRGVLADRIAVTRYLHVFSVNLFHFRCATFLFCFRRRCTSRLWRRGV